MSEHLTGVTFLAFGNGAPDLFSTFNALQQGSYGLALGELLGAATIITTCVIGSVAIITGFKVSRRPFLRDISFFLGAIALLVYVIWDGKIYLLESLSLILLYCTYVATVGLGRYLHQRKKKEFQRRANLVENIHSQTVDNDLIEQADRLLSSELSPLFSDRSDSTDTKKVNPMPPGFFLGGKPSPQDHYDPWFFKHKTISSRNVGYFRRRRKRIAVSSDTIELEADQLAVLGDEGPSASDHDINGNNNLSFEDPSFKQQLYKSTPVSPVLTFPTSVSERSNLQNSPTVAYSANTGFRERFLQFRDSIPDRFSILKTFLPILETWEYQSSNERFVALLSIPASVLLLLTIPVVDSQVDDSESSIQEEPQIEIQLNLEEDGITRLSKESSVVDISNVRKPLWPLWLTVIQCFIGPLFVCTVLGFWTTSVVSAIILCVVSVAVPVMLILFSSAYVIPWWHKGFSLLGFMIAIVWIYLIAGEILSILQSIGIILSLSEAILGLTVFAVGNSLPDLVANVSVARMGYPNMAVAACLGGPMLNILIGIGVSSVYYNVTKGVALEMKFTPMLMSSSIGLVISLISTGIIVPKSNWSGTKNYGFFLMGLYLVIMIVNICLEITSSSQ